MKERQILDTAISQFENLTKWNIKVKHLNNAKSSLDAESTLQNPEDKQKYILPTEIKNEVRNSDMLNLIQQKQQHSHLLIIAQYISKPVRAKLQEVQINYLESSGNCFIKEGDVFIFIDSQKPNPLQKTNTGKLYSDSGMRFVYATFLNHQLIEGSYRQMAEEAEVALGSIGQILEDLKKEGFIKTRNGNRLIQNNEGLFELWVREYGKTMRPKLLQNRMSFTNPSMRLNWQEIPLKEAYWGGEPAANLLDKFLIPEHFLLYSPLSFHQLMKQYKLIPNNDGEIFHMVPAFKKKNMPEMADPFLVYAELMESNDSRCHEAATRIKKKYIDTKL